MSKLLREDWKNRYKNFYGENVEATGTQFNHQQNLIVGNLLFKIIIEEYCLLIQL